MGDVWLFNWNKGSPSKVTVTLDGGQTKTYQSQVVPEKKALWIKGQSDTLYSKVISLTVEM